MWFCLASRETASLLSLAWIAYSFSDLQRWNCWEGFHNGPTICSIQACTIFGWDLVVEDKSRNLAALRSKGYYSQGLLNRRLPMWLELLVLHAINAVASNADGQLDEMRHREVVGIVEGVGGRRWTMRGRIWRKSIFIWYGLCTIRLD